MLNLLNGRSVLEYEKFLKGTQRAQGMQKIHDGYIQFGTRHLKYSNPKPEPDPSPIILSYCFPIGIPRKL